MKSSATTTRLDAVLERTPAVYEGEPLLLAELDDLVVEQNVWKYVQRADLLEPMPVERTVLLGPITDYFDRWPVVRIDATTPCDLSRYNRKLFENYDFVRSFAFTQSEVANRIEDDLEVDVIALILFDGLSYLDWLDFPDVQACLVEGPTITPIGFRNVVGRPSIAHRLFNRGFRKRLGFSHWDRSNTLTDMFFRGFDSATQMFKVNEFREVLLAIDRLPLEQTYIQILTNGLDAVSHRHRGRPPVKAIARHLYEDILMALVEHLMKMGATALVYATADHGILWKPEPDRAEDLILVRDERAKSHRYAAGSFLIPHSRQFYCYGANYTVLAHPYFFHPLSSLEWGAHGGISFQESVVPFVKKEVI